MTTINYTAIEEALASLLRTSDLTRMINGADLTVVVEHTLNPATVSCPWAGIYLDSWETPANEERIGGASPFLTQLTLELWLYAFGLEDSTACAGRDALLSAVKDVLKTNRTLNGNVLITRFKGGQFDGAAAKNGGFFRGVSLKIQCEIRE